MGRLGEGKKKKKEKDKSVHEIAHHRPIQERSAAAAAFGIRFAAIVRAFCALSRPA